MSVERHYNLKFLTYQDTIATIRVPKAAMITPYDIMAAMDKIVNSGVVAVSKGLLKSNYGADLVSVTVTDCEYEKQF